MGEREEGERCDFLVPFHNKRATDQIVALAHFYVGDQELLTRYGVRRGLKEKGRINTRVKDRRQKKMRRESAATRGHLASTSKYENGVMHRVNFFNGECLCFGNIW
jgi:hypothetical protein